MNSRDGIIGLAIGDAMGVPLKFMEREKLLENPVTEMTDGGIFNKEKGVWSESTSLTLATIESIIHCFGISITDMGNKYVSWMQNSEYTATGERFDIGRTTMIALSRFQKEGQPFDSGSVAEDSNGNDILGRMLPIAYYAYASNLQQSEIYSLVKKVAGVTHAHELSILGAYIYVMFSIKLLEGKSKFDSYKEIQKMGYSQFSRGSLEMYNRILKKGINTFDLDDIRTSGYIVDSLEAVLWVILNTDSFNQAIIGAINLGNETDRIGACTGGLAGLIYGLKEMNVEWRIDLRRYTYIRALCGEFDKSLSSSSKKFEKEEIVYGKEEQGIKIIQGDITRLIVDAYVNSANNSLLGGSGVDGAIHKASGPELIDKCRELSGCETGEAKITRGYESKAKFIIHTVAPKWYDDSIDDREMLLKKCYENSIIMANDFNCKRIAFPCLGMGVYGCPLDVGGRIAIDFALKEVRKKHPLVDVIYLVCYSKEEYEFYTSYLKEKINEKKDAEEN